MRVVLTTPPFDLFKDGYGSKRSLKKGHLPPLGIGYIASVTLKAGFETFIVDPPAQGLDFRGAVDAIVRLKPDIVGISVLTANNHQAIKLAEMVKAELNVPVIMGGPHATCYPEEILKASDSIDYVVSGEGEKPIIPLLENILKKTKPYNLRGVSFKDGASIINNGKSEIEYDIDNIDPPAYQLYRHELYSPLPYAYRKLPATSMTTSRGCPYSKCAFCFSAGKMKERYRRSSPSRVVDDMADLVKMHSIKEVIFCDDNFLFNERWIAEFCELLRKSKIGVSWSCAGRADTVSFAMLKNVKDAGCWTVFYGFESGVQKLLDTIKKGITLEEIRKAAEWTHAAGLETRGSFMLALPGETTADALETIRFAISLNLDYAQFHATFPDLGTELFDIAKSLGWAGPLYRGTNKATFVPAGYKDGQEVEKTVETAYKRFYFRPKYIIKRIRSIKNISDMFRYMEGFFFVKGLQ